MTRKLTPWLALGLALAMLGYVFWAAAHPAGPAPVRQLLPIRDGVTAISADCVPYETLGKDSPWGHRYRVVGRFDGDIKTLPALDAMSLQLTGHSVQRVWACPPAE